MNRILITIRSWFTSHPGRKLGWSVEDFKIAKRWAKSQFDPMDRNRSLWSRVYSPRMDSLWVIDEINKHL